MKKLLLSLFMILSFSSLSFGNCVNLYHITEKDNYNVFIPIAKYISLGDAESLSAWFDNNIELKILSTTNNCSKRQGRQIIKSFFNNHRPRNFKIIHKAERSNMKYALGNLDAGGDKYEVNIFINIKNGNYRIKVLKIEKKEF